MRVEMDLQMNENDRRESNASGYSAFSKGSIHSQNHIITSSNLMNSRHQLKSYKNLSSFGICYQIKEIKNSSDEETSKSIEEDKQKKSSQLNSRSSSGNKEDHLKL
jgi:hypothetical protein